MATINIRSIKSSGGDFTSRRAWILSRIGDYVTTNVIEKAEVYAFADTLNYTIDGLTTGPNNYPWIYVMPAERHPGKWDDTKAKLEYVPTSTYQTVLRSNEDYIVIEGDQLSLNPNGSANIGCSIVYLALQNVANKSIFRNCILRAVAGGTAIQGGFYTNYANPVVVFAACVFHDFTTGSAAYLRDGGTDIRFYNCTFATGLYGIDSTARNNIATAKNCVFSGLTTSCLGTFAAGTDYNATSNTTLNYTVTGAGNTHDRVSQTFSFVDAVNKDFHLTATDGGASGFGVDLSADAFFPFNYDIDNQTISAPWPIGADYHVNNSALAGAALVITTANGTITTNIPLSGVASGVSAAGAALTATVNFSGTALATAAAAAGLNTAIALGGAAQGSALANASMTIQIRLQGAAVGSAAASAGLTANGGGFAGAAQGAASGAASLTTGIPLLGAAVSVATGAAGLSTAIPIAGASASISSAVGSLDTAIRFTGAAVAQALGGGNLSVTTHFDGAAIGTASASGLLSGGSFAAPPPQRFGLVWPESRSIALKSEQRLMIVNPESRQQVA